MSENNNWILLETKMPEDGVYVQLKDKDGHEFIGKWNILANWWRIVTENGILRIDLEDSIITHWKPENDNG